MIQIFKDIKTYKSVLLGGVIILLLSQIFFIGIKEKMHQRIPESQDTYLEAISIVISHHKYKLKGYVGYRSVYDALIQNGFKRENNENAVVLNQAIARAYDADVTNLELMYHTVGDIGYIDYINIAFQLFGPRVESLFYLYILILSVAVFIFSITFYRNRIVMAGLILYLLCHYILGNALVGVGHDLWVYQNNRFMPVLGLLPISYVCLLVLVNKKIDWFCILVTISQVSIYILLLRCRMSAFWMVVPLVGVFIVAMFRKMKAASVLLGLVLLLIVSTLFIKRFILDEQYFSEKNLASHTFWHTMYLGLAINPEIREIYGKRPIRDVVDMTERFQEVCDQEHPEDSQLKAKLRIFVCNNRNIVAKPLLMLRRFNELRDNYTENDQDGAQATLNWLRKQGKTEEYLYTFGPEDKVGYPRYFSQCDSVEKIRQHDPQYATYRPFDAKKDFKWRRLELTLKEVVLDAWRNHTFLVIKTIFIVKPIVFLVFCLTYLVKITTFIGWGLLIGIMFFLFREFHSIEKSQRALLLWMSGILFLFSMIVPMTAYPKAHTISDQSLLLTMFILGGVLYWMTKNKKKSVKE